MANEGVPMQTLPGTVINTDGIKDGGATLPIGLGLSIQKKPTQVIKSFNIYASSNIVEVWDMIPFESAVIQIQRNSGHKYTVQGSNDGIVWFAISIYNILPGRYPIVPDVFQPETSSAPLLFGFNKTTRYVRIVRTVQGGQISPVTLFTITLNAEKLMLNTGELSQYYNSVFTFSTGALEVTSAANIIVANIPGTNAIIAASYKNGIKKVDLSNSEATATMVQLLDGIDGAVKWTRLIPASGSMNFTFDPLIEFSLGNAVQLKVVTAGAKIYGTIQGTIING